jgi:2'-5' RNA ligase
MAYAVELYFDPATTERVTALTRRIFARCGGEDLLGLDFRPHISLAAYAQVEPDQLRPVLAGLARTTPPFTLQLSAIGLFPTTEGVVYLAPVVTRALLQLHDALNAQAAALGIINHPYYQPGHWIPHCTVAQGVAPTQVGEAVHVCLQSNAFGPGQIEAIGLIEHRPVQTLLFLPLGGG